MKKIALIIITALTLNLMVFAIPTTGHAAESINSPSKTFNVKTNLKLQGGQNQPASYFNTSENSPSPIVNLIKKVIEYASYVIGSIAVILVIASGFMMMVSQGNQQKVDEAKEIFKYAMIGLVIVFMSYIITIFIQSIFISAK
jgi:hypothetical protein